eukprot:TRINITY_DN13785_c0_g1_i1.p1 TRINITY_DN13785_c0_g1~~TRINITY_DN13785_c0_g1_i1.p1  ORF type:complete len:250 (+),score=41.38 TRINITY_DN13785_c0_g1_i1:2-751(+)
MCIRDRYGDMALVYHRVVTKYNTYFKKFFLLKPKPKQRKLLNCVQRCYRTKVLTDSQIKCKKVLQSGHIVSVRQGDITEENVEVVVNAANGLLRHSGGLAKAIVDTGGEVIQLESDAIIIKNKGSIGVGMVAVTTGGNLPAKFVIHAVGPKYKDGQQNESEYLKSAVRRSLETARERNWKSIAIPAISSGIYGYPKDECAEVIIQAVDDFCHNNENRSPKDIRLLNFDHPTVEAFVRKFLQKYPGAETE